jgi:hypothetical protein
MFHKRCVTRRLTDFTQLNLQIVNILSALHYGPDSIRYHVSAAGPGMKEECAEMLASSIVISSVISKTI